MTVDKFKTLAQRISRRLKIFDHSWASTTLDNPMKSKQSKERTSRDEPVEPSVFAHLYRDPQNKRASEEADQRRTDVRSCLG